MYNTTNSAKIRDIKTIKEVAVKRDRRDLSAKDTDHIIESYIDEVEFPEEEDFTYLDDN